MNTPASSVTLAPPGAGLPAVELFFANLLFHSTRWLTTRPAAAKLFHDEWLRIQKIVASLPHDTAVKPALIRRLVGLEDSSRAWSVYMTLDHLCIVNEAVRQSIAALAEGHVPERPARTADVKPRPGVGAETVELFDTVCKRFESTLTAIPDLRTRTRFEHPWFGPLDAAGWHYMAGFHMALHRRQIAAILSALAHRS